jgi:thiol-disulfide isomerase/thioredoxin
MRTLIILSILWLNTCLFSQGIAFETDWKTAREKALKDKKLLFIDFYTDWCPPCKLLEKETFIDSTIGNYFQKNFIAIKFDADKEEGAKLKKAYNLGGYPTLLFVQADHLEIINRYVGFKNVKDFLDFSKSAFQLKDIDPLSILQKKYDVGLRERAFLEKLMQRKSIHGINVKEEMKVYLQSFSLDDLLMSLNDCHRYFVHIDYSPSDIAFFRNVKRKKDVSNMFINGILGTAVSAALDSAFKTRNFALFNRLMNENNLNETPQKLDYYRMKYAEGDSNTLGFFNTTKRYINTYLKTDSLWSIRHQDSLSFVETLKAHKNSEDTLKKNLEKEEGSMYFESFKHQKACLKASSIVETVEPLLKRLKDKNQLQEALTWTKYAYDLMPSFSNVKYVYAVNLYKVGDKSRAISIMAEVVKDVKEDQIKNKIKYKTVDIYTFDYQKMKQGNF